MERLTRLESGREQVAAASPAPWRFVWLAGLAASLAWILHLLQAPPRLEPRMPWVLDGAAAAAPGPGFTSTLEGRPTVELPRVESDRAAEFIDESLVALNSLADRINLLRRISAQGLESTGAGNDDLVARVSLELAEFDRFAEEFDFDDIRALNPTLPIAVDLGEEVVQVSPVRWRVSELDLPELRFASRADAEEMLGALDRAYYRLVAEYRDLKRLRKRIVARD